MRTGTFAAELAAGLVHRGGDPAQHHLSVLPALDVGGVVAADLDHRLEAPSSSGRRCEGLCNSRVSSGVVGPHAADDDVGQVPFVGAAGLPLGLVLARFLAM